MSFNKPQRIALISFVTIVLVWLGLKVTNTTAGNWSFFYSFIFGLIPFFGGLYGMFKARIWGGLKSALGRAVFYISFGLFLWGFGENIWSYYNFFKHVAAPYPSIADLGFAPSIFFWILGTIYLSRATGAWLTLKRSHFAKFLAIAIPLVLLIPSYYIQVKLARGGTIVPPGESLTKAILDIAYPFGDFLALTFAAVVSVLSYRYFGGVYRRAVILLLVGLFIMYCADTVFSYTTTKETYYNGDWGDLLLAAGQFVMTYGILAFASKPALKKFASKEA